MANRDNALQVRRYKKESSPGAGGTPDTIAPDLKLMIALAGDTNVDVVPSGYLFAADSLPGMYSGKGTYELPWSFSQLQFILDSLWKNVTATGANLTKTRVWAPSPAALDTITTYYVEAGQTGSIDKYNYLVCNSLKGKISKREAATPLTGDVLAQFAGVAAAFTGSPTALAASVVPKIAWNIFTATTWANLTASPTQVSVVDSIELDYGPLRTEEAFVTSATVGWDALGIGVAPKNSVKVTVPKDVSGSDYVGGGLFSLAKWQNRTTIFLRAIAQGAFIETVSATDYYEGIIVDMALRITAPPPDAQIGPFVGQTWTCELVVDPTANKAIQITTLSTVA